MQRWTVEYGTLWALEAGDGLPAVRRVRPKVVFKEVAAEDIDGLATVMSLPDSKKIDQRLQEKRRCFSLQMANEIVAYGWVSHGKEYVGELEREFHLTDDEAYIWDCGTVPAWRGYGYYTVLLGHVIHQLHGEGVSVIWIGASRKNRPSVRGIASAGFKKVVDVTYRRFFRLTLMWLHQPPASRQSLIDEAYRILISDRERRLGPLVVGHDGR